ncbi:MAG: 2-alkenal reductase, partial [Verrucomicrobiales bacterium]|nr:2-alkenal reductase [Verrucomicrobiales bacterium]
MSHVEIKCLWIPSGMVGTKILAAISAATWEDFAMSKIVGIDLGTTNSLVSTVDSGIPYVIAGVDGRRLTPSVVHFPLNAKMVVGNAANRIRAVEPERTFYSVKRFIGRKSNELTDEEAQVNYPLGTLQDGCIGLKSPDRLISPEEVSAEILKKLRGDATLALGEEITRAVITVPAYFNDAQRTATKRAAELAGLVVERMVNEPTAAALAYGLDKLGGKSKIAVYDLGGGTFDLSILELNDGIFQVLSTNGNTRLGGDDIDAALVEFLLTRIEEAQGPDCRPHAALMARLRDAGEAAKIKLSSDLDADIALPFLTPEFSFHYHLTRRELDKLAEPIIAKTRVHCLRSLADAKLQSWELDQVILVGGQTRMPLVRQMVKEIFGCVDFESVSGSLRIGSEFHRASGPMLNTSQNPDEAVALGAAIQAEILSGGFKNMLLLDITPLSLGIETFGGLMNVIIPRNSTIPIKAGEVFTTAMDNQPSMLIHVLQGERDRAKD